MLNRHCVRSLLYGASWFVRSSGPLHDTLPPELGDKIQSVKAEAGPPITCTRRIMGFPGLNSAMAL